MSSPATYGGGWPRATSLVQCRDPGSPPVRCGPGGADPARRLSPAAGGPVPGAPEGVAVAEREPVLESDAPETHTDDTSLSCRAPLAIGLSDQGGRPAPTGGAVPAAVPGRPNLGGDRYPAGRRREHWFSIAALRLHLRNPQLHDGIGHQVSRRRAAPAPRTGSPGRCRNIGAASDPAARAWTVSGCRHSLR